MMPRYTNFVTPAIPLSALVLILSVLTFNQSAYGQTTACQTELEQAEQAYTLGNFDETIRLVDLCLTKNNIQEAERQFAFRLKGLSYIGKGLEADARAAIHRLLELVPSFQADPIQDPPSFVSLIEEVKQEINTDNTSGNPQNLPVATGGTTRNVQQERDSERNRVESWYTNWGFGYPFIQYPDADRQILDELEAIGANNLALTLELLGFYLPLGTQTIVGTAVNAWGDQYSISGENLSITAYTFGASMMHFLQNNIGDGLFIRVDVGPSRLVLDSSLSDDATTSKWGLGILAGGGYGMPISRETRILFHLNYSIRRIEEATYGNLGIGVTGLF